MRKTVVVLLTSLLLASLPAHGTHVGDPGLEDDDLDLVVHDCLGDAGEADHPANAAGNDLASVWVGTGYRDFDFDNDAETPDETLKVVLVDVVLGERSPTEADGAAARLHVRMEANNRILGTVLEAVLDPEPDPEDPEPPAPAMEDWRHPDGIVVLTGDSRTNLVPLSVDARDVGQATTTTPGGDVPTDPRTYRVVELAYRFADVFAPDAATATAPFTIEGDEWHVETFQDNGETFASADVMTGDDPACTGDDNASATVEPDAPVVTGVTATPDEDVDRRPETKVRFHALLDLGGGDAQRGGYAYDWAFVGADGTPLLDADGDPITSTAAEPQVRFVELAPVHVRVRVTDDLGKQSALYDSTQDDDVPATGLVEFQNLPPVADFRIQGSAAVAGSPVTFQDLSFDPEGDDVVSWSWEFADGSQDATSTLQNPTHTFESVGTYDVKLTVTDEHHGVGGMQGIDSHVVRVFVCDEADSAGCKAPNIGPQASFTASSRQVERGQDVTFTDGSTDADGTIASWSWDFGDGATSDEQSPTHTFTQVGTFSVTLTVTDDGGLEGTRALPIRVIVPEDADGDGDGDGDADLLPAPLAAFTLDPEDPVVGEPVRFRDNSTAQTKIVAWTWFFGDGSGAGDGADVTHTYEESGTYKVRLTVTDERGVRDTTSQVIQVGTGQTDADTPGLPVVLLLAGLALAAVAVRRR